jgi:hypothetical protein
VQHTETLSLGYHEHSWLFSLLLIEIYEVCNRIYILQQYFITHTSKHSNDLLLLLLLLLLLFLLLLFLFSQGFPGTFPLEPVVNLTNQASGF